MRKLFSKFLSIFIFLARVKRRKCEKIVGKIETFQVQTRRECKKNLFSLIRRRDFLSRG